MDALNTQLQKTYKQTLIKLQQENKWGQLDTFFKEHSQYYKQIDNDEVVFIVGTEGTDFIANLFLNNLKETITNNRIQSDLIWNHMKYNRQGPEPWFDDHIIWDSPGHYDFKQHTLLSESFKLLKTLKLPETLSYNIDTNLKDFFSSDKTLNGTRYFITRQLPVISYFYYKNFEKVKIILIDITDVYTNTYVKLLHSIRTSFGIGNSAILSPRHGRTTQEAWAEEQGFYTVLDRFKEIQKVIGNNEFVEGPLIEALVDNQWTFINDLEQYLSSLKNLDVVKPLYVDILHNLSSKNNGGMMDFPIFSNQLYKMSYKNLFYRQNHADIKILMKLFNAKHSLEFYEKEIRKYNIANMELKNKLEIELFLVLDKLKKDNK